MGHKVGVLETPTVHTQPTFPHAHIQEYMYTNDMLKDKHRCAYYAHSIPTWYFILYQHCIPHCLPYQTEVDSKA